MKGTDSSTLKKNQALIHIATLGNYCKDEGALDMLLVRKLLLLLLFLFSASAFAQGTHRVSGVPTRVQSTAANLVPFAKIRVCIARTNCATLQTVYSDIGLTQVKPQPLTADADGNFDYYVAPGCYDEQYSAPGIPASIRKDVCTNISVSSLFLPADPVQPLQAATRQYVATRKYVLSQVGRPSAGTAVQKGNGNGGFSNATIADLNQYTPGKADAQESTIASMFTEGNTVVTAGPQGPTDGPCPSWLGTPTKGTSYNYIKTSSGFEWNCYLGNLSGVNSKTDTYHFYPVTTATNGKTQYIGHSTNCFDHSFGASIYTLWHTSTCEGIGVQSSTPGINHAYTGEGWFTGVGDLEWTGVHVNSISGHSTTGADESVEVDALQFHPLGSVKGTAKAKYAANESVIYAPASTGCGGVDVLAINTTCSGGGRPLIKIGSGIAVTATATVIGTGEWAGWMQITTSTSHTVSYTGKGTVSVEAGSSADTYNGQAYTAPLTIVSGTFPPSGTACWVSTNASGSSGNFTHETVNFTYDGTNITVLDQRVSHVAGNSRLFVGACQYFVPSIDATTIGSSVTWLALVTDKNTIMVTNQLLNEASPTWLGAYGFNPSAGRGDATLYDGAEVVSVSDPSNTVATPRGNGGNNLPDGSVVGFYKLQAHTFSLEAGDVVENTLLPIDAITLRYTYCGSNQPSNGVQTTSCSRQLVSDYVNYVHDIALGYGTGKYTTGGGYWTPPDIYYIENYSASDPYNSLFRIQSYPSAAFFYSTATPTNKLCLFCLNASSFWLDHSQLAAGLPEYGMDNGLQTTGNFWGFGFRSPIGTGSGFSFTSNESTAPFNTVSSSGFHSTTAGTITCDTSATGNAACTFNAGTVNATNMNANGSPVCTSGGNCDSRYLQGANNLSDLGSVATAQANLGYGSLFQTAGTNNGSQTSLNLVAGANVTLSNSGATTTISAAAPTAPVFQTNGSNNGSQSTLNLQAGSGITLSHSGGTTTISATGGSGIDYWWTQAVTGCSSIRYSSGTTCNGSVEMAGAMPDSNWFLQCTGSGSPVAALMIGETGLRPTSSGASIGVKIYVAAVGRRGGSFTPSVTCHAHHN